jgi:hypothetical protein
MTYQQQSVVTPPLKALSKLLYLIWSVPFPRADEDVERNQREVRNPSNRPRSLILRVIVINIITYCQAGGAWGGHTRDFDNAKASPMICARCCLWKIRQDRFPSSWAIDDTPRLCPWLYPHKRCVLSSDFMSAQAKSRSWWSVWPALSLSSLTPRKL